VGRVSHTDLQPNGGKPVAPSAIPAKTKTVLIKDGVPTFVATSEPRALDAAELPDIVHTYQAAARNAVETAGFDGVEIHAANGYLLDQFLKSGSNQRTDDYGGSLKNRARLLLEVVRAVTGAIGGGRTGIRLSPVTPANDAFDADPQPLFDYVVRQLAKLNLAYIHIIEGATGGARALPDRPFDYAELKAAYRAAGGKGAWMVNNGYNKAMAEQAVQEGADLVAFGKPFIANPDLVERLRLNTPLNTPDAATFYGGGAKGYTDYPALYK
jgi:N-ethylmaleimide reductase